MPDACAEASVFSNKHLSLCGVTEHDIESLAQKSFFLGDEQTPLNLIGIVKTTVTYGNGAISMWLSVATNLGIALLSREAAVKLHIVPYNYPCCMIQSVSVSLAGIV